MEDTDMTRQQFGVNVECVPVMKTNEGGFIEVSGWTYRMSKKECTSDRTFIIMLLDAGTMPRSVNG
jgi:hypothetical protein